MSDYYRDEITARTARIHAIQERLAAINAEREFQCQNPYYDEHSWALNRLDEDPEFHHVEVFVYAFHDDNSSRELSLALQRQSELCTCVAEICLNISAESHVLRNSPISFGSWLSVLGSLEQFQVVVVKDVLMDINYTDQTVVRSTSVVAPCFVQFRDHLRNPTV